MPIAHAAINTITLKVGGIDCQYCAYSLGKRLTQLPGVQSTSVNPNNGTATMVLNGTEDLNLLKIETLFKNSPFNLKDMRISATGKIIKNGDHYFFAIANNQYKIYLLQMQDNQPSQKSGKFFVKLRSLFKQAMAKISSADNFEKSVRDLYNSQSIAKIKCTIHNHRDRYLGLSNYNVSLQKIKHEC